MEPKQLIDWAATAGPASIFALLWWLERGERRDCQKAQADAFERCLKAIGDAAFAIQSLKDLLTAGRGR